MTETPLYVLSKRIVDNWDHDISERLMKWRMFSAQWKLETENFYGKSISYNGIKFEGSPRLVFWEGYIEPFLEDRIIKSLNELENICRNKNINVEDYIHEMESLLKWLVNKTYNNMADIDQILRGGGFPKSVNRVIVSGRIEMMNEYISKAIAALLHKKPNPKVFNVDNEIVELKPNFFGFGINLRALWRKFVKFRNGT